jgi:ribose 5-phosphate isomerase A
MNIAEQALSYIADGQVLGLGTGRAATAFVVALGERVRAGLKVRGVPTSEHTADLALQVGVPLTTLDEAESLDFAFDGADEVDPQRNLIKGYGGALLREKIVAAAARRLVILVTPDKLVGKLGGRGRLPIEVVPFGAEFVRRRLTKLGLASQIRQSFITDNANWIVDATVTGLDDPAALEREICAIPGVVDTGLFLGMADMVLIQHADRVEVRTSA